MAVATRQVQVALGALWWAVSGCSPEPSQGAAHDAKPVQQTYGVDRPLKDLAEPTVRDDAFRRGATLGLFSNSADDETKRPLYTKALDELVELGATDVQLLVEWTQTDRSAIEITPSPTRTVDDELLRWVIDEANQRSLRVLLMPSLDVAADLNGAARTSPHRAALTPPDWDRWWWSYRRFVVHYAQIAEGHKAAMLSVGSDLTGTEQQAERWHDLIKLVRRVYHGPLTYAASWDAFENVSFWDELDVVGISGQHALAKSAQATDQDLDRGAQVFTSRLHRWALAKQKRYLLTDVGYPARAHAAERPWDTHSASPADALLQLRCYRALFRAFQSDPRLLGMYASRWFDDSKASAALDGPRGRPAAEVLRHWYKRSRSAETAAATGETN